MKINYLDNCKPSEIAVKSFFLGPNAENKDWLSKCINQLLADWFLWRQRQSKDGFVISDHDKSQALFIEQTKYTEKLLSSLSKRFEKEIPKFLPRYIGHMFSEISMPALLGHILTLLHNPNNISAEASRVGIEVEKEAIAFLCNHMGYKNGYGHFTSGGTLANFEFLFRARERIALWISAGMALGRKNILEDSHMGWAQFENACTHFNENEIRNNTYLSDLASGYRNVSKYYTNEFKGPILLVPQSKHYSWPKAAHFLGIGQKNIWYIELDKHGRVCIQALRKLIEKAIKESQPIAGIVGIAGTTEMGSVDPIDEMAELLQSYYKNYGFHFWLHIDAAYGGFFRSLINNSEQEQVLTKTCLAALRKMEYSDSMTLDPHKLGYVPYASGVFLCKKANDYFMKSFTGPYIVSEKDNSGNFTIEGSRSAAGAVATWLSLKSLEHSNGYAQVLNRALATKLRLQDKLLKLTSNIYIPDSLDTNIICFLLKCNFKKLSEINAHTLKVYNLFEKTHSYWISKTTLEYNSFKVLINEFCNNNHIEMDTQSLCLLRVTIMNPFLSSRVSNTDHLQSFCDLVDKYSNSSVN